MKRLFLLALFTVPVYAAPISVATKVTIAEVRPAAPKGDIRVLVREAMAQARRNGDTDKATEVGQRSAEALPFLGYYSRDNNWEVRFAVMLIAQRSHSRMALRLLSNVLVRPERLEVSAVGGHVLRALGHYQRTELSQWGGETLHKRLLLVAGRTGDSLNLEAASALTLLPAFPDEHTKSLLETIRRKPAHAPQRFDTALPLAPRPFVANIVLAEIGDRQALSRLQAQLAKNHTDERVWLCQALPFIQSKSLLRLASSFLSDTRPVKRNLSCVMTTKGAFTQEDPPTRLCDVAQAAVELKMKKRAGLYVWQQAKPAELEATRMRFARWLDSYNFRYEYLAPETQRQNARENRNSCRARQPHTRRLIDALDRTFGSRTAT